MLGSGCLLKKKQEYGILWTLGKKAGIELKISSKYQGILFILLSALCFACMNVCVRLSGDIPTIQKSFFRNIVAFAIAAAVLLREGKGIRPASSKNWPLFLARSFFGTVGILANFYAVDHLLLSDASMLNKMSPFFAVIASFFILHETFSFSQGLVLLGAFAGAMFVVKPSFSNMDLIPSLVGLAGGLCAGIAYTCVRKLGQRQERGPLIVFVFSGFSCLTAVPFMIADFCPMTLRQTLFLLGAGLCAAGGQFSVTAAYCHAPAREISVYDYSQVIFSAVLGFFIFGDRPDLWSILGYLIICSMAFVSFLMKSRET